MKEGREELIGKIRAMRDKGMKISEISRATGLSRPTVRHYLRISSLDSNSDEKEDQTLEKPKIIGSVRKAFPIADPSPGLKAQREETEKTLLEVEKTKALKELDRLTSIDPLLNEKVEVGKRELELKKLEVERRLKKMKEEEIEAEKKQKRAEYIEQLKRKVLPLPLQEELPVYIKLIALIELSKKLNELDISSASESELVDYCRFYLSKILSPYKIEILQATLRGIFSSLEKFLQETHRRYLPQFSFDEFLEYIFSEMITKTPKEIPVLLMEMRELGKLLGRLDFVAKVDNCVNSFLSMLEKKDEQLSV